MQYRFIHLIFIAFLLSSWACSRQTPSREIIDFNLEWKFYLGELSGAEHPDFDDSAWRVVNLPHDWSIEEGYYREGTAASTGFVKGGMGWYRKTFSLSEADRDRVIRVDFDGVYNKSTVWINGNKLGFRPYGYSSFSYELTPYLYFDGRPNVLAVQVDHRTYADSRWYTGSGIYRKVRLVKTNPLHVAHWGVQVITPEVSAEKAALQVKVRLENNEKALPGNVALIFRVIDADDREILSESKEMNGRLVNSYRFEMTNPRLWDVDDPHLYTLQVKVLRDGSEIDRYEQRFGIRSFKFDPNTGFWLNGRRMKIKGVNMHHDAGAVGAAVTKALWEFRIDKLKSIGVNAIRMAHNPHAVELMEVCDEKGMLVMAEAFDEWSVPKGKSLEFLGDNKAPKEAARAYPEYFNTWAERDLKDLVRRDFNHPSVILWSIGNEIEWTFPHYVQTYARVNGKGKKYYKHTPIYDSIQVRKAFDEITGGHDLLAETAMKLSHWVKEIDTTRPVTAGSVHPSIGLASGYGDALDVYGFNYRAIEYDAAHRQYPYKCIIGSENWGAYSEWKNCVERDFVSGIFAWTGFAYLGEAGPWPKKGLEISFFDFAGFKTPRGHFFECLWKEEPKIYMVTTPQSESEFSYTEKDGWKFDMHYYKPPFWPELRLWEWYKVYPKWQYAAGEPIVVQTYTNCEEAELFLNGRSLGKQLRSNFADDNIVKWLVPYEPGSLKVVGYNNGKVVCEYLLATAGKPASVVLSTSKEKLQADGYDVAVVSAQLLDEQGNRVTNQEVELNFEVSGAGKNIGVDNGSEYNVSNPKSNKVETHWGRAVVHVQSARNAGEIVVRVSGSGIVSNEIRLVAE